MNPLTRFFAAICAAAVLLPAAWAGAASDSPLRVMLCDTPGERAPAWLAAQAPDVAVLAGLPLADAEAAKTYARRYGHTYTAVSDSRVNRVAVTANVPIETVAASLDAPGDLGFLHVRIAGYDFLALRLTPFDGYHRIREAEDAVRYLEAKKLTETCTVLGSFGSVSAADQEALRDAPEALRRLTGGTDAAAMGSVDAAVQSVFLGHLYHDPLPEFLPRARRTRGFAADEPSVHTLHVLVPKAYSHRVSGASVYEAYPERTYFAGSSVSVDFASETK